MPNSLTNRKLLVCGVCGWVHYAMTEDEKANLDGALVRYHLRDDERDIYEAGFRQCLRCESPVSVFRKASEADVARALGHIVTPVLV
jgi:methylphosphotriester-DNA--protein-cysteine methyltransferase